MFDFWDRRAMAIPYAPGVRKRPAVGNVREVLRTAAVEGDGGQGARGPDALRADAAYRAQQVRQPLSTGGGRVLARDVMTSPVEHLPLDTPLDEARTLFTARRFRHVPVVDATVDPPHPVGMLSDRDLLQFAATARAGAAAHPDGTVAQVMSDGLLSARPQTELRRVAQVMFEERVGAMPVVDDTGRLVGIITRSDILRALIELTPWSRWV